MNKDEMLEDIKSAIGVASFYKAPYQAQEMTDYLWRSGYRKVGEDEIIIKKSEYEELKTHIEDLQTKLGAVMLCIKNTHEIDISDLLEKQKRATAREIFYKLKETLIINNEENTEWFDYDFTLETINELANKYGIELEEKNND